MHKKINIQFIADALELSRNTVSKVINNKPVPNETRERVIKKAIELGYKGFGQAKQGEIRKLKLLLLAGKPLSNLDFFTSLVKGVENLASHLFIDFFQYTLNPNTSFDQLKNYMSNLNIDGVIVIEFYDDLVLSRLLSLSVPIVFIDAPFSLRNQEGNFDVILMEGRSIIEQVTKTYLKNGYQHVIYCGDHKHCQGFYDRFLGLRDAYSETEHPFHLSHHLILKDDSPYEDASWLGKKIASLPVRPQVIVCANDFIAINTIQAIFKLKLRVPEDIQVIGFDDIVDAQFHVPSITTIHVNKEQLGQEALYMLMDRINRPNHPSRVIYFKTTLVKRHSTRLPL